jgi:hypothetical protein
VSSVANLLGRVSRPGPYPHGAIFLIGSARSGTTMLTDLFRQVPALAVWPNEANDLWHPALYPWYESSLDVPPYFVDGRTFTEASLAAWSPRHGERIRRSMGWFQRLARRERLMVKTVTVSFMLPRLVELFPDARFIHLIRDPYAVARSQVVKDRDKLEHPRYAKFDIPADDTGRMALYARHWREEIEAIRSAASELALGPDHYREVPYDELCAHPASVVTSLLEWLDVPPLAQTRLADMTAHVDLRAPEDNPPAELRSVFETLRALQR